MLGRKAIGAWLTANVFLLSVVVFFRWTISNPLLIAATGAVGIIALPLFNRHIMSAEFYIGRAKLRVFKDCALSFMRRGLSKWVQRGIRKEHHVCLSGQRPISLSPRVIFRFQGSRVNFGPA